MGRAKKGRGQRGFVRVESGAWIGYWSVYVYDPEKQKSIRKQRSIRLGNEKEFSRFKALNALAPHIEKSLVGTLHDTHTPDGSVTLEQFSRARWLPIRAAEWRSHTDAKGREVNPARDATEYTLSHIFKSFGGIPLERLDKVALQIWLTGLAKQYSESVVKHVCYAIQSICEEAVQQDYLRKNPARGLKVPKDTKKVNKATLKPAQFKQVLAYFEKNHSVNEIRGGVKKTFCWPSILIRTALATALRPSELFALRWKDFDPQASTFTIRETVYRGVIRPFTKTTEAGTDRADLLRVVLPEGLSKELDHWRGVSSAAPGVGTRAWSDDDDLIFVGPEGKMLRKENVLNRVIYPAKRALKLPMLNFQVLRRTFATLAQTTGTVKDVQSQLRHTSPNVTAKEYMQPIEEGTRKTVTAVYDSMVEGDVP